MNHPFAGRHLVMAFAAAQLVVGLPGAVADDDAGVATDGQLAREDSQTSDSPPSGSPKPTELPPPLLDPFRSVPTDGAQADETGYEPLLRGPLHEAFATPTESDGAASDLQPTKRPPPAVDEQPPEVERSDEGMKWIPGYWSWSDEADDYVWVSGMWRRVPPGRFWVPGFWSESDAGYRWTNGYWSGQPDSSETTQYLPQPPDSIDNGPSVPPPRDDCFWVPGQWEYAASQYQWRGGYWSEQPSDWVWHPDCYVSTPAGYRWVDGYWDYLPPARGYLYAPVHFYDPLYLRPNYVYRPRYPLANAAALLLQLFVRPGYSHYYYGNYYGSSFAGLGYRPWYDFGRGSPWLSYYDWQYRKSGIHFAGSMHRYGDSVRGRPPQSFTKGARGSAASTGAALAKPNEFPSKGPRRDRTFDSVVRSNPVRINSIARNDSPGRGDNRYGAKAAKLDGDARSKIRGPISIDSSSPGRSTLQGQAGRLPSSIGRGVERRPDGNFSVTSPSVGNRAISPPVGNGAKSPPIASGSAKFARPPASGSIRSGPFPSRAPQTSRLQSSQPRSSSFPSGQLRSSSFPSGQLRSSPFPSSQLRSSSSPSSQLRSRSFPSSQPRSSSFPSNQSRSSSFPSSQLRSSSFPSGQPRFSQPASGSSRSRSLGAGASSSGRGAAQVRDRVGPQGSGSFRGGGKSNSSGGGFKGRGRGK